MLDVQEKTPIHSRADYMQSAIQFPDKTDFYEVLAA